jgi:hypothetical protein
MPNGDPDKNCVLIPVEFIDPSLCIFFTSTDPESVKLAQYNTKVLRLHHVYTC